MASSLKLYDEVFSAGVDRAILFCLHNSYTITSLESMQVLFDMVTPTKRWALQSYNSTDTLERTKSLKLLCDVASASARKLQLARSTLDWLRGICDDVFENSSIFLEQVGLTPVLLMLSIWSVGDAYRLYGLHDYDTRQSYSQQAPEFHRLQTSAFRFIRQLITGTSGDQFPFSFFPNPPFEITVIAFYTKR